MVRQTNNLIIYTPRTGSTILAEILSASSGCVNLNEGIVDSCVSPFNKEQMLKDNEWKEFVPSLQHILKTTVINNQTYDFSVYHKAKQKRIDILKNKLNWTVKETCVPTLTNIDFIKHCCDNQVNVYMVYRKNIVDQFISFVNIVGSGQSIFTSRDNTKQRISIRNDVIEAKTLPFINSLIYWRLLYEMFQTKVKLVCYEDVIKPMNFLSLGVDECVVKKYNLRDNHLIPTPFNIIEDSNPKWLAAIDTVREFSWVTNTL